MNRIFKASLLALSSGLAVNIPDANAVVTGFRFSGNAVSSCQAFKPGPASNISNRAIGIENDGAETSIACSFVSMINNNVKTTVPTSLLLYFANNNSTGSLTVTCSMLAGRAGGVAYVVTKTTAAIPAGGGTSSLLWNPSDNPVPGATDLGNVLVNVNCRLPTGALISETYLNWNQDDGVGT